MRYILNLFKRKNKTRVNEEMLAMMQVMIDDIEFRKLQDIARGNR